MILITGAQGQLGREFQAYFRQRAVSFLPTDREELDVADADAVRRFFDAHPNISGVIHCAAYNNVDRAETEREACARLNTDAPALLAELTRALGVPFVTYSTDFVFDGAKGAPYTEADLPNPLCHYAQTKRDGEVRVLEKNPASLVIRTSWLFGAGGVNFVRNFISLCETRTEIRMVTDQISAPTYTGDLADATWQLLQAGQSGLFHVSNAGTASKFDFALAIAREIHWEGRLIPITSDQFPAPARRPAFSKLATEKVEKCLNRPMVPWQNRLREVILLWTKEGH